MIKVDKGGRGGKKNVWILVDVNKERSLTQISNQLYHITHLFGSSNRLVLTVLYCTDKYELHNIENIESNTVNAR